MTTTQQRRRAKRRAQSLVFEAIEAADDGDPRRAEQLAAIATRLSGLAVDRRS